MADQEQDIVPWLEREARTQTLNGNLEASDGRPLNARRHFNRAKYLRLATDEIRRLRALTEKG